MKSRNKHIRVSAAMMVGVMGWSVASCSIVNTTTETQSYQTLESSTIHLVSDETSGSDSTDYTHEAYETFMPTCEVENFTFDIDRNQHYISANYSAGHQNIIFNMPYNDYGITEAGVYSVQKSAATSNTIDIDDRWQNVEADTRWFFNVNEGNCQERIDVVINSLDSFEFGDVNSDEELNNIFNLLSSEYDVLPSAHIFSYDMSEYANRNATDENYDAYIELYNTSVEYESIDIDTETNLTKYTLRQNLDGLPIGYLKDNRVGLMRRLFENYAGSFSLIGLYDDPENDYYLEETNTVVDFVNYNFDSYSLVKDKTPIVPIEDCIQNVIPEILNDFGNTYYVYGAELTYVPFEIGCDGMDTSTNDIILIPVWAFYFVMDSSMGCQCSSRIVLLNSYTGESFARYTVN